MQVRLSAIFTSYLIAGLFLNLGCTNQSKILGGSFVSALGQNGSASTGSPNPIPNPTPTPVILGNQSLIPGCAVDASNNPTCAIPSGWKLRDAQGFEGSVPETTLGNLDSSMSHSGSKSLSTTATGDQATVALFYTVGAVNDVYISQWRYESTGTTQGADHYLARIFSNDNNGNAIQECIVDPQDVNPNYITLTAPNTMECQNSSGNGVEATDWPNSASWTITPGVWVQYEFWFHGNTTCTGAQIDGASLTAGDGFYRFYVNGKLQMSGANVNLTNCNSFVNNPNLVAEAVFLITTAYYANSSGGCLPDGSSAATQYPFASNWATAPKFQIDGVSTCWGSQPDFKVALDDIIIMTK